LAIFVYNNVSVPTRFILPQNLDLYCVMIILASESKVTYWLGSCFQLLWWILCAFTNRDSV